MRKEIFIFATTIAVAVTGCAVENSTDDASPAKGLIGSVTITQGEYTPAGDNPTRAGEEGYRTVFEDGDRIGITAVGADGVLLADNLPYKFDAVSGGWLPDTEADLFFYPMAAYIAYYPYDAAINGIKTTDEIFRAFTPALDQSIKDGYTGSDLMLWSGSAAGSGMSGSLDIKLEHAMSLIIVEPEGVNGLAVSDVRIEVTAGGIVYNPYPMPDGKTWRVLITPGTEFSIAASFNTGGATIKWNNGSPLSGIEAGKYIKYNVSPH